MQSEKLHHTQPAGNRILPDAPRCGEGLLVLVLDVCSGQDGRTMG